jgi:hypothetical protein
MGYDVTEANERAVRRAERLLRAYPPAWRARYGDEFLELLVADIDEQPTSWHRTADIAANGGLARLNAAGVIGSLPVPADQVRSSLGALWAATATFFLFGAMMWSQVVIGWRWEPPTGRAVAVAMVLMSVVTVLATVLAALAAGPLVWALARAATRRRGHRVLRSFAPAAVGVAVLTAGSRHFENSWPGTGGHPWAYHRLVPPGVSAFVWAATRGVTSYWLHPSALRSFPAIEVAWMAVSVLAIACVVVGLTKTIRRLEVSPAVWRYEANLARATGVVMLAFLTGAASWVFAANPAGPTGVYRVGTIDVVGLVVMAVAWAVAQGAGHHARVGALALAGSTPN